MNKKSYKSEYTARAVDDPFDILTDTICSLLRTPSSVVLLRNPARLMQFSETRHGSEKPTVTQQRVEYAVSQHIAAENTVIAINDCNKDTLFAPYDLAEAPGFAACMGAPIRNVRGELLGSLIAISSNEREWTTHDMMLMETLSSVASQSIQLSSARLENDELRLEQAEFCYSISHDLKSPVNTLHMLTSEMREMWNKGEIQGPDVFLTQTEQTIDRMSIMIEDTLEYSLLTTKPDTTKQLVSLEHSLTDALSHFSDEFSQCQGTITSQKLPRLEVNRKSITLLFQQLISNSIRFHSPGRPLIIAVNDESDAKNPFHTIVFSDNGIGIEAEHLSDVFSLFARLHTRDQYSGTGLGLSICRRIVHQHHGHIDVESTPGSGTRMIIKLPRGKACQPT